MTDTGSDSTMTLVLETDDNAAFASATTAQTLGTFSASSAVGSTIVVPLQLNSINERYIRVGFTVANGNLTTGSFTTFITNQANSKITSYATGYVV